MCRILLCNYEKLIYNKRDTLAIPTLFGGHGRRRVGVGTVGAALPSALLGAPLSLFLRGFLQS